MLNIIIYCFKKKSEINVCFLLNTYSFSTLKFNSLSDLIILSELRIEAVRFHVDKVFFGTPKKKTTSLRGVPFSNSLNALYFILYELFSARCFVATDAVIVKFQNVGKQCVR